MKMNQGQKIVKTVWKMMAKLQLTFGRIGNGIERKRRRGAGAGEKWKETCVRLSLIHI